MNISLNNLVRADGDVYRVVGIITYRNSEDSAVWNEYRLISVQGGREKWLSIDDVYREYSISEVTNDRNIGTYHRVDSGTQEVIGVCGDVDVDVGERASFKEYEDSTEEKILSVEIWEDGAEYSRGYYLDEDEIQLVNSPNTSFSHGGVYTANFHGQGINNKNMAGLAIGLMVVICGFFWMVGNIINGSSVPKIASYLKRDSNYTYVTSVTGNEKQKADVYKSSFDLDTTARAIINAIEGNTLHVRQNTDDGDSSVGILTKKEYCLVYISEDSDVLVQISNRKYAYSSDKTPYRSTTHTHRYYRRFYRSTGYSDDSSTYRNISSPYSSYSDTTIDTSGSDPYSTYSGSVRQDSINSRKSSGGGSSSGK